MKFNKKIVVAVSSAFLLMAGQIATADSTTDIVDALVAKGVLTEEEGRLITKGHVAKQDKSSLVKEKEGTFSLETADGKNSMSVNGRIHFDYRHFGYDDNGTNAVAESKGSDTFDLRRARIGLKGKFAKYYSGEIVINAAGVSGSDIIDVAYLDVNWFEKAKLRFGQFKMPFSLEQLTSSNNIDFIERSFVDGQIPAKERGVQIFGEPILGTTYAVAIETGHKGAENTSSGARELDNASDGLDVVGRFTANLGEIAGNKDMVGHLGLALSKGDQTLGVDGIGGTQKTRSRSDLAFFTPTTPSMGAWSREVDRTRIGLEGAFAYGPLKIQGQYVKANYEFMTAASTSRDYDINSGYIQALWTITGEKHSDRYKAGVFGGLKPAKNFDPDTLSGGAWEVGFRYGKFDGKDYKDGGYLSAGFATAADYTLGVKFVANPNVRFMFDYMLTEFDDQVSTGTTVAGKLITQEHAALFRTQLMF